MGYRAETMRLGLYSADSTDPRSFRFCSLVLARREEAADCDAESHDLICVVTPDKKTPAEYIRIRGIKKSLPVKGMLSSRRGGRGVRTSWIAPFRDGSGGIDSADLGQIGFYDKRRG